ncbi:Mu transposase C-terminal domain-containing protein [Streptomyces sp. NPDC002088]|uniref:Mu transposase C-terminal domain-containing protein n=1 Tax=Streptomyces sp. NPDC002088 TaxID=3154665 RepID=UPI00332F7B8F
MQVFDGLAGDRLGDLPVVGAEYLQGGIKVNYRTYDSPEFNRLRRQPSGMTAKQDLWEVHYDPYDVSRVWVRRSDSRRWIEAPWTHLPMVRAPFAGFTWRHARQLLADQGKDDTSETAVAQVLAKLLRRSGKAPAGSEQVLARTRAAIEALSRPALPPATSADAEDRDSEDEEVPVTPFGVFNPLEEEGKPLW